jgi:hypothetical protein
MFSPAAAAKEREPAGQDWSAAAVLAASVQLPGEKALALELLLDAVATQISPASAGEAD